MEPVSLVSGSSCESISFFFIQALWMTSLISDHIVFEKHPVPSTSIPHVERKDSMETGHFPLTGTEYLNTFRW